MSQKTNSVLSAVETHSIDPTDILTLTEVAERLKVTPRWVYERSRCRCADPLPTFRVGRHLRFSWAAVSVWLQAHSNAVNAEKRGE